MILEPFEDVSEISRHKREKAMSCLPMAFFRFGNLFQIIMIPASTAGRPPVFFIPAPPPVVEVAYGYHRVPPIMGKGTVPPLVCQQVFGHSVGEEIPDALVEQAGKLAQNTTCFQD